MIAKAVMVAVKEAILSIPMGEHPFGQKTQKRDLPGKKRLPFSAR
jgi:hypothetical protein